MYVHLFLIISLLEFMLVFSALWRVRIIVIPILVFINGVWAGLLLSTLSLTPVIISLLIMVSIFKIINLLRAYSRKINEAHLRKVSKRTNIFLTIIQSLVITLSFAGYSFSYRYLIVLGVIQFIASIILFITTVNNLKNTKYSQSNQYFTDKELPSVTVAIPARNEGSNLTLCIEGLLANDYPKLEIIVLDDCSSDNTSDIIKSFAHKGVRFVPGYQPKNRWLAKNLAYDKLADESSGEIIIFCSADTRFGKTTIRALVTNLITKKQSMTCVLPYNIDKSSKYSLTSLRYWWELSLPRKIFNRPPVSSDCWAIKRDVLINMGGFDAVSHNVIPEGYFARELIKTSNYSFIRAMGELDVALNKNNYDKLATEIRLSYPELRKRIENVLLFIIIEIVILFMPIIILIISLFYNYWLLVVIGLFTCLLLSYINYLIIRNTSNSVLIIPFITFPLSVITQLYVTIESMRRYEFGTVIWKDRNICLPVMHVIPKLPQI